jgi:hypothetical protein
VVFRPFGSWLQTTALAAAVGQSQLLTAFVSGVHLLGLTLIVGAALISSLRLLDVVFGERSVVEVTAATRWGITVGLIVSVASGVLLVAPRAAAAVENRVFQIKMLLLVAAVVVHFVVYLPVTCRANVGPALRRVTGAAGLALWFGVAAAACVFILFE